MFASDHRGIGGSADDLANPTSNRIYQSIGYEPVTDVNQYRFERASDSH